MHSRASELIATLDLEPHPEGGFFRRIFRSASNVLPEDGRGPRPALTSIYYLLTADTPSRWHRVRSDEAWHLYEGGPLELLELELPAGSFSRHLISAVGGGGSQPVHVIAAGNWQAARSEGPYALMGCTVGPGFDFADFVMLADDPAAADIVRSKWPELADFI